MSSLVVSFGEIMLRLAPPGFERFLQSPQFVATFGGGEANVAVAVAGFGLPARYVTGHLPDIGFIDPGTPMDFHAYCEVYLGQEWLTFDARFNVPRIGRVKVAHGADAVDGAFATIYGEAALTYFHIWAYQVNPQQVSVGDPIDLSKRLDGNPTVRLN